MCSLCVPLQSLPVCVTCDNVVLLSCCDVINLQRLTVMTSCAAVWQKRLQFVDFSSKLKRLESLEASERDILHRHDGQHNYLLLRLLLWKQVSIWNILVILGETRTWGLLSRNSPIQSVRFVFTGSVTPPVFVRHVLQSRFQSRLLEFAFHHLCLIKAVSYSQTNT